MKENYLYTQLVEESQKVNDSSDIELVEDTVYISIDMLHLLRRGVPKQFKLLNELPITLDIEIDKVAEETRWWGIFETTRNILSAEGDVFTEDEIMTPYKLYNILEESLDGFLFDELIDLFDAANDYELDDIVENIGKHIQIKYPYAYLTNEELEEELMDTSRTNKELYGKLLVEDFRRSSFLYSDLKDKYTIQKVWKDFDSQNLIIALGIVVSLIDTIIMEDTPINKGEAINLEDICFVEFDIRIEKIFYEAKNWCYVKEALISKLVEQGAEVEKRTDKIDFSGINFEDFIPERLDYILDNLLMQPELYKEEINKISAILCK